MLILSFLLAFIACNELLLYNDKMIENCLCPFKIHNLPLVQNICLNDAGLDPSLP